MVASLLVLLIAAIILYCVGGTLGIGWIAAQNGPGAGCARLILLIGVIIVILVAWLLY